MKSIHRRDFIKKSCAGAGLLVGCGIVGSAKSYGNIVGSGQWVRVPIVGGGVRGPEHLRFYLKIPNVEVVEVIDPDSLRAGAFGERVAQAYGRTPRIVGDFRKMLDNKDVDVVSIASCNHWHALMGIWAYQAGKDALVEKPCSYNVFEGRKLAEAAEKYKRIVQHGTQRRSQAADRKLVAAVRSEKYGKLKGCRLYVRRARKSIGFKPVTPPPPTLDWNQWIGPAEMTEFHGNLAPYNWHWFWNTGNGEIANNGVHNFDVVRWALNAKKHPRSVISFGMRFMEDPDNGYKDQGETPSVHFALYDFDGIPLVYEGCNVAGPKNLWPRYELSEFHTDQGILRETKFYPDGKGDGVEIDVEYEEPAGWLFENFIDRVRDRDAAKLDAPILEGHYSSALPHWGNISYRCGRTATLEEAEKTLDGGDLLHQSIENVYRNLKNVLPDVNTREFPLTLGAKISIDNEKESCVDNPDVDKLLARPNPRAPFIVPDTV